MVNLMALLNTTPQTKKEIKMAKPTNSYFESRPDIVRIFEDLESFHDFCRFELREFNPAELYKRDAPNYGVYINNNRTRKPYRGKNTRSERKDA
jgi:hypothetical protein